MTPTRHGSSAQVAPRLLMTGPMSRVAMVDIPAPDPSHTYYSSRCAVIG